MPILLMVQTIAADPAMATYRAATRVAVECAVDQRPDDIVICGRRAADRYRVPLIERDPAARDQEGVMAERTRLLARTTPIEELSPFLVGGGMVGIGVSTNGGVGLIGERPIAP